MKEIKNLIQLEKNEKNDSRDYIKEVSNLVKTQTGDFDKIFKEWIVSSVANLYESERNTNSRCLILCGGQGTGKSAFWSYLFQPIKYLFTGHISLTSKDSLILLTDTFLVVLDEQFSTLKKDKDWTRLKKIVVMPKVGVRKHYQKEVKTYNRIANFCGSSNLPAKNIKSCNNTFVSFDLIEPIDIDKLNKIPIHKMWKQAYKLYQEKLFITIKK